MPVTEFSLLTVLPPNSATEPPLSALLSRVETELTKASGKPFHVYLVGKDTLYLIGAWDSIAAHEEYLYSDANRELLEAIDGIVEATELLHVDVDCEKLPLKKEVWIKRGEEEIKESEEEMNPEEIDSLKGTMGERVVGGDKGVKGGWVIDHRMLNEDDEEEEDEDEEDKFKKEWVGWKGEAGGEGWIKAVKIET